jgi:hypothetical protein
MPHCQPAEIFFTLLIGGFTLALMFLTLREDYLRSKGL